MRRAVVFLALALAACADNPTVISVPGPKIAPVCFHERAWTAAEQDKLKSEFVAMHDGDPMKEAFTDYVTIRQEVEAAKMRCAF